MPNLVRRFNFGDAKEPERKLYRQLDEMYSDISLITNGKVSKYVTNGGSKPHVDPPANDAFNRNFELGDIYVRSDTDSAWIMTSRTDALVVNWQLIT